MDQSSPHIAQGVYRHVCDPRRRVKGPSFKLVPVCAGRHLICVRGNFCGVFRVHRIRRCRQLCRRSRTPAAGPSICYRDVPCGVLRAVRRDVLGDHRPSTLQLDRQVGAWPQDYRNIIVPHLPTNVRPIMSNIIKSSRRTRICARFASPVLCRPQLVPDASVIGGAVAHFQKRRKSGVANSKSLFLSLLGSRRRSHPGRFGSTSTETVRSRNG